MPHLFTRTTLLLKMIWRVLVVTNDFLPTVPYSELKPIACCLEVEE